MIHAYDKVYLDKARTALGRMLDFSVYDLSFKTGDFFDLFLSSGISSRFETGDYAVTVGISGVELAYTVLETSGRQYERIKPRYTAGRSREYWAGWALAYYQWETGLKFADIIHVVPIEDIVNMYTPYHEMDIRQFCDHMTGLIRAAHPETQLKRRRENAGLSQSTLAEQSGISVRTIQQYEQRQKNINHAQAEHLARLSKVLYCSVEDLMEQVE